MLNLSDNEHSIRLMITLNLLLVYIWINIFMLELNKPTCTPTTIETIKVLKYWRLNPNEPSSIVVTVFIINLGVEKTRFAVALRRTVLMTRSFRIWFTFVDARPNLDSLVAAFRLLPEKQSKSTQK